MVSLAVTTNTPLADETYFFFVEKVQKCWCLHHHTVTPFDFLDNDGAYNPESGIVGTISLRYFSRLAVSAMQVGSCFLINEV